jgi:zinc protease
VIPLHSETLVAIATDKEATGSSVSLLFKHPHRAIRTVKDYRAGLVEDLYGAMLNARFADITHRAHAPFLNAGGGTSMLGRTLDTWNLGAAVVDSGIARGLGALLDEAARVRRYGFLPSELTRAREERRKWSESAYAERDKSESDGFANSYARVFLAGEPELGIEAAHALDAALLDGVTLDEVNAVTPRLMHPEGRVLLVNAPEKAGTRVPTEAELRAILDRPADPALAPWADSTAGATLMASLPKPGTVVSRRVIEPLGVTVLQLSNGAEVWLKPTDFKADEVLIGGYSMGGVSLADSATFWTSALATSIVADGGVGGFTGTELQKLLAGRIAYLSPYASAYTQGVSGQARPADLETELQLVHLYFTRPTENPGAFGALRQRLLSRLADRANSPEQVFADTVSRVNSGGYFAFSPLTPQALERVELKPALEAYRKRFTNAADYTFFLVGAFQVDSVVPPLARYLGSLPSTGQRTAAFADRGPRFPRGVRKVVVRKGVEPKARTVITFFVNDGLEELDLHRARACASILTECLRRSLREMLGGTYSASASFNAQLPAPGYASMSISFGCDPARVDSMVAAALAEVRRLRDEGPSLDDVKKDQEIERRELEVSMKQNSFWIGSLQTSHQLKTDPLRILKRAERIDLLTPDGLKATFGKYFPMDRYTVITLLPEEGAAGGKSSP